jgi:hypothetical protein
MAKATGNAIRISITVPADVKADMDGIKESVNWSSVASEAFRAKVLELKSRKTGGTMNAVVERLKASKQKHDDQMYRLGREAGENWAKNSAEAAELERLTDFERSRSFENWEYQFAAWGGAGCSELLDVIKGEDAFAYRPKTYWDDVLGDGGLQKVHNDRFAIGFVESAIALWEAVEKEM